MSDSSRRKLLKSIAAGSGAIVAGKNLPESWSRPVVDSVMLPAHAQTSPQPPACSGCFLVNQSISNRYTSGTFPEGTIEVFNSTDCSGGISATIQTVEAVTQQEAYDAYVAAYGDTCGAVGDMVPLAQITCANVWICDE